MTIFLPWLSDLHDAMFNKSVSWTSTSHLIDWQQAHSIDVGNMTHDLTRHDNAGTFVLLLECMLSYSAAEWWMSSLCIIASPPHGEVLRVFDGPCFTWWSFSMLFLSCMLEGLTGSFFREGACSSRSFALHASFIRPLVNLPFCMCSIRSSHSSSFHIFWCTCTCSHSWWDDIKSKTS